MLPVSSMRVNTALENALALSRIRFKDARESGIEVGYWTARKVNTICVTIG